MYIYMCRKKRQNQSNELVQIQFLGGLFSSSFSFFFVINSVDTSTCTTIDLIHSTNWKDWIPTTTTVSSYIKRWHKRFYVLFCSFFFLFKIQSNSNILTYFVNGMARQPIIKWIKYATYFCKCQIRCQYWNINRNTS